MYYRRGRNAQLTVELCISSFSYQPEIIKKSESCLRDTTATTVALCHLYTGTRFAFCASARSVTLVTKFNVITK